ncbi:glycosyltransferase [Acinetobacter bereziniae]|uniref:glycosyltransferase family 4 protein n=1 Tax=Acinetobacter bereziniae TaxID=106648 RepID=UPI00258B6E84|nr:glycosyltransferase [uncultured Acinetobacter sp.]
MKKKNFICIFPQGENIHLIKDVGMIPFVLGKEGYYNTTIAFYEDQINLPYLRNEVNGLNYERIPRLFKYESINILLFLIKNLSKYNIVMFFHGGKGKIFNVLFFKLITLKRMKFYFKLDMDSSEINNNFNKKSIRFKLTKVFSSYIDLLTVESIKMNDFLNKESFYRTKYLPNGYLEEVVNKVDSETEKENIIITVGRLGTNQKDTETFLKALAKLDLKDWKVKLIGPIAESFQYVIKSFFEENPHLKEKVIFMGNISDRQELKSLYSKAKIFTLTSRNEGFPLVFPEAIANGCYIVTTDLAPAYDITNNGEYGRLFTIGNDRQLAIILQEVIDGKIDLPDKEKIRAYAKKNFDWNAIAQKLYQYLEGKDN